MPIRKHSNAFARSASAVAHAVALSVDGSLLSSGTVSTRLLDGVGEKHLDFALANKHLLRLHNGARFVAPTQPERSQPNESGWRVHHTKKTLKERNYMHRWGLAPFRDETGKYFLAPAVDGAIDKRSIRDRRLADLKHAEWEMHVARETKGYYVAPEDETASQSSKVVA